MLRETLIVLALGNPLLGEGEIPMYQLRPCRPAEVKACRDSCQPAGAQLEAHSTCSVEYAILPGFKQPNVYGPVLYCGCLLEPQRPGLVTTGI